jgi:hypothetical protein
MGLIALAVFAEQVLPGGQRIRVALGIGLALGAVTRIHLLSPF